jgi:CHAT domain-containing protein
VWQRYGGADHIARSLVLVHLAGTLAAQGAFADAMDVALLANSVERNHARLTVRSLPEREGLDYTTYCVSRDVVLSLAAKPLWEAASRPQEAWDAVIRSRSLVLDEMASRHRVVRVGSDPNVARATITLAASRERLARLMVRGPGDEEPATYLAELDQVRREKERAELELAAISESSKRDLARARFGFEELFTSISPDEAVIAYVRYNQLPFDAYPHTWGDRSDLSTPSYVAFVAEGSGDDPILVRLGPASEIDTMISNLRQGIAGAALAGSRSTKRAEASYRYLGKKLRRILWDPLLPHLEGTTNVHIVPDGALNLINFAALPTGESGYLVEAGRPLHYLSAERDLLVNDEQFRGDGLLVLGDPAFDEPRLFAALRTEGEEWLSHSPVKLASLDTYRGPRSSCGTFQTLRFEPLPGSAAEIDEISELWTRKNRQRLRGTAAPARDSLGLRGPTASEDALKAMAPGRRVLHLATHGFFLGSSCPSALGSDGASNTSTVIGENPLLFSGLALAGANHREAAGPNEEDGILTAEEIATLDLTGVEWAVLSACDTGVGEVRAGEGVFGLRRAFQIAGVRTLIMSLWPVEDEASREWMKRLYENRFVEGLSTAESVHRASLGLLQQRREEGKSTHPFFWAGFVAAGDWR